MKIVLVSATAHELQATLSFLEKNGKQISFSEYSFNKLSIYPLITGVGSPMASFALARHSNIGNMDLLFHVGICGSYNKNLKVGELVEVSKERWGDLGAEEWDCSLIDVFELGLCFEDQFPFTKGWIENKKEKIYTNLRKVSGLTLNKTSGCQKSIDAIVEKYSAEVESMEGAAIFYAARMWHIPFLSIRAISNIVEPRNKYNWNIGLALDKLNNYIIQFFQELS